MYYVTTGSNFPMEFVGIKGLKAAIARANSFGSRIVKMQYEGLNGYVMYIGEGSRADEWNVSLPPV